MLLKRAVEEWGLTRHENDKDAGPIGAVEKKYIIYKCYARNLYFSYIL